MFNSMRIKIITAFVIITTVPLLLLTFFVYREMETALQQEIREGTSKEMLQIDRAIVIMLQDMKEDCQYLATNPFVEMADAVDAFYNIQQDFVPPGNDSVHERIYRELERYAQQHPETAYVYLGTEKGGFIGWPRRPAQKGLEPRTRPWYRPAIEKPEETFLSEPYETFDGTKFTVTVSHFVRNFDGAVIGVLGIDANLDRFTRRISEIKIGKMGYAFMLARDGTIMAHPNREFLGHNITKLTGSGALTPQGKTVSWNFPEYQRLLTGSNAYFETTIDGQRCFVNMQTSSLKNWTLVTVVAADEIAGRAKQVSFPLAVGTAVLLIMILPFIAVVSFRLTRCMDELVRHLTHMAGGDFSERLPESLRASHDEIGGVARAIDFMQTSRQQAEWELQASNEELAATYGQLAATEAELRAQLDQLRIKTQELAQSEERYRLVAAGSNDAIWDWDVKGRTVTLLGQWADAFCFSHSFTDCDIFDPRVVSKVHPDDVNKRQRKLEEHLAGNAPEYNCEFRVVTQGGEILWVLGRGKALFDDEGELVRMAGSLTDITQKKMQSMKIRHLAYHDALTGLDNRLSFLEKLAAELEEPDRSGKGALLFIDLDNFKMINDTMGHAVGDQFLVKTASALTQVAQGHFVARLGGDEFIIILSGETDRQAISEFARKLIRVVGEVCTFTHDPLTVTLSIGISLYPADGKDTKSLLKSADIAMQCAKKQGKHRYEFFTVDMETDIIHKIRLETGLRKALKNGEFVLHYQPIINADKQLVAFEALIRWHSPEGGLVSPAGFIPVAEESDLIVEIGEWVLETACGFGKKLHDMGLTQVHMSVNVSAKEWLRDDFPNTVIRTLEKTGFPKDCLDLEIVETMLIENFKKVTETINILKKQGVRISLDDFGTGYSTLSYLSELPVNIIKIDRTFVGALLEKSNYAAIVRMVVQLAHEMGFDVVAEGVETPEQLSFLLELKCDRMQGYLISKPLEQEEVWKRYIQAPP